MRGRAWALGLLGASFVIAGVGLASRVRTASDAVSPPPASASGDARDPDPETPPVRPFTSWRSTTTAPLARIAEADARLPVVKALFGAAGVAFPPAEMLLRVFKRERLLELWAGPRPGGALTHVTTYAVCGASGSIGPKRREGDLQVPEGFYTISDSNPASRYHLAMLVSYPNMSDRLLGDRDQPGGEIMIHGDCASAGCLAMSDERIEEIWVAVVALRKVGGTAHVHVFPTRDLAALLASDELPEHHAFWANLKVGHDLFEERKRLPVVRVDPAGRYRFR